jgi:uncharacterized protein (TIGR04222 family)
LIAAGTICAVVGARVFAEAGPPPALDSMDPYLIANLRGGNREAIRVALVSLLDRGLLKESGGMLDAQEGAGVRHALERAILDRFATPADHSRAFEDRRTLEEAETIRDKLEQKKLLPGFSQLFVRAGLAICASTLLGWLSWTKYQLAIARGHHNVLFLFLATFLALAVLIRLLMRRRTSLGDRVVSDLRTLFSKLRERRNEIPNGGATNELALLAGVYGLEALPAHVTFGVRALLPQKKSAFSGSSGNHSSGWFSSSCGSSCGSSGGSSCGSSCGGGGCGGGCGGCGGS